MFGGTFAPQGWNFCDGSLLSVAQNQPLYSILGNTYGGTLNVNFAVPDLRGRAPMSAGPGPGLTPRSLGVAGGESVVTLTPAQMPQHIHTPGASTTVGSSADPKNNVWAAGASGRPPTPLYGSDMSVQMGPQALAQAGGGSPHNNMQPYAAVNFIICTDGDYPPKP